MKFRGKMYNIFSKLKQIFQNMHIEMKGKYVIMYWKSMQIPFRASAELRKD